MTAAETPQKRLDFRVADLSPARDPGGPGGVPRPEGHFQDTRFAPPLKARLPRAVSQFEK